MWALLDERIMGWLGESTSPSYLYPLKRDPPQFKQTSVKKIVPLFENWREKADIMTTHLFVVSTAIWKQYFPGAPVRRVAPHDAFHLSISADSPPHPHSSCSHMCAVCRPPLELCDMKVGWKVHRLTMMQWSNLTKCGLCLHLVFPAVHTLLPSVLQHLHSRGVEALILILEKVLNCRYDLIIGPILLPSNMFFHVGEQKIDGAKSGEYGG